MDGKADLVGILFQPPGECEHDIFWDDDYQSGSIKTWLKKKYTGPYFFNGITEDYEWAQYDFRDDWTITITKEKDCKELLQKGYISKEELLDAEATILTKHKPVCIYKDGAFVLDV